MADDGCGRHFVKNDLPKIRYLNPRLDIEVDKPPKTREETWKPEMVVELSACQLLYRSLLMLMSTFTTCR